MRQIKNLRKRHKFAVNFTWHASQAINHQVIFQFFLSPDLFPHLSLLETLCFTLESI